MGDVTLSRYLVHAIDGIRHYVIYGGPMRTLCGRRHDTNDVFHWSDEPDAYVTCLLCLGRKP